MTNYPITENSIVFELGAYEGQWAREICNKYNPNLYAFEPQKWAYESCVNNLKKFPKAKVFNFGIGIVSAVMTMGDYHSDGASFMKSENRKCDHPEQLYRVCEMVEISKFLKDNNINEIDLLQMNIEGYEYVLLPYMIGMGLLQKIKYLIVQFHMHPWFPGEEGRLIEMICKTHKWNKEVGTSLLEWERI